MNTEQIRAAFEAWGESIGFCVTGKYAETVDVLCAESAFKAGYQAGRAALQSQAMQPEIGRDLLGKIVDEVFDGAIEDASVIEDIYRVVARECALQSQDREDAERYRWLLKDCYRWPENGGLCNEFDQSEPVALWVKRKVGDDPCAAIDRARRSY